MTSLWPRGEWRTSRSVYQTPAPPGKHTFPSGTSSGRGPGPLSWCQTGWAAWPGKPQEPGPLRETLWCPPLQSISAERQRWWGLWRYNAFGVIFLGWLEKGSHPKCPVSIYSDNEVDYINEKHEGVDITHRTVLWVDDVIKKLSDGEINVKAAVENRRKVSQQGFLYDCNIALWLQGTAWLKGITLSYARWSFTCTRQLMETYSKHKRKTSVTLFILSWTSCAKW